MPGALVVGLGDAVRALRAREALVRLLSSYAWFIGARLAVKPDGQVVLVAVTTSPSDPEQRAAILARVASHLGGVRLEDRSQNSEMDQARAKHEPGGKDGEKQ